MTFLDEFVTAVSAFLTGLSAYIDLLIATLYEAFALFGL